MLSASAMIIMSSCVSSKKYAELEAKQNETQDLLNSATVKLNSCLSEKKDSVTLALVTSLKGVLGNLQDEDIEVNVEKGVVFISISDKLLFKTGSYKVSSRANGILGKVAKVVLDKPDMEFMVEGHTDNVPYKSGILEDNWDLSVKRATAIVRELQTKFGVPAERMTAAGRSSYVPIADNSTAAGRATNRRIKVVVLPKLDQFYSMIEQGMKEATEGGK